MLVKFGIKHLKNAKLMKEKRKVREQLQQETPQMDGLTNFNSIIKQLILL